MAIAAMAIAGAGLAQTKSEPAARLGACGDVMMSNIDSGIPSISASKLSRFMEPMGRIGRGLDGFAVNLEGPLAPSRASEIRARPKSCQSEHCHRFLQSDGTLEELLAAGVSMANIANNHAADYGWEGKKITARELKEAGMGMAGLGWRATPWELRNGQTIWTMGFSANVSTPDLRDPKSLEAIRAQARAGRKPLVVFAHMGCEGERCARLQGGVESFVGENRGDPKAWSRAAVEAGADAVIGSGPHAPRGLELWKGRLIAWSLGNCAVGPGLNVKGKSGMAPLLIWSMREDGELDGWALASFKNEGDRQIEDEAGRAEAWMREASRLDGAEGWEELERRWKAGWVSEAMAKAGRPGGSARPSLEARASGPRGILASDESRLSR